MEIRHHVENDGLTLVLEADRPEGGVTSARLSWANLEAAQRHYQSAIEAFERTVQKMTIEPGQKNKCWRITNRLYVGILAGPPTWWFPRMSIKLSGVMVGWLRRGLWISWKRD